MKRIEIVDVGHVPKGGILKSSEFENVAVSDDIIRNTQNWAVERRRELEERMALECSDAVARAYDDGIKGFLEAQRKLDLAARGLSKKLEFLLRQSLDRVFGACVPQDILAAAITPVLTDLERQSDVRIEVHPNSIDKVRGILSEHPKDLGAISVAQNLSLEEAECAIFSDSEIIRASQPILVSQLMTGLAGYINLAQKAQLEELDASTVGPIREKEVEEHSAPSEKWEGLERFGTDHQGKG